ncbi:organic cation transporter protein [Tetranychus urticae]|uniref:Major facilitator superfamily (MFS) profile domain-containing protein n=1 Tax=Tetranychus urticae TaxID=32264 RepID=T1KYS2_TETUR|nr:organic cation transporter protein [Tetranychus urticae]
MSQTKSKIETVSDIIGGWGPWHTNIFLFYFSCLIFSVFDKLTMPFFAPPIDYWCSKPLMYKNSSNICSANCEVWTYDKSFWISTVIDKWDLVCGRSWLASFAQSCFMAGVILGAVIFARLSDDYGRLTVLRIAMPLEIVSALGLALSPSIYVFIFFKFIQGIGSNGRALTGYLLLLECVGTNERGFISVAVDNGFALGYILLPGVYYFLRDFQTFSYFHAFLEVFWVIWLFKIPESIRWQLTHDQIDEAEVEMIKASKMNKTSITNVKEKFALLKKHIDLQAQTASEEKKAGFLDLWRSKALKKFSLVLYFSYFVNAFVYYGLSLNIGDLNGNLFISFFLAGLVEFPSYIITSFALKHIGRKTLLIYFMNGAGLSCLSTVFFLSPADTNIRVFLAMIGKFCVTSSFTLCYVYASEIYPTVLRQSGLASCSIAARFGCIIAPFVKELTAFTSIGVSLSIFGSLSIINGALIVLLPETRGLEMPSDIAEAETILTRANARRQSGDIHVA